MKTFTKHALTIFFLCAYLFDIVTFLIYKHYKFEVNPIYLLTGNIFIVLAIKTVAVFGLIYIFYNFNFKLEWFKFFFVIVLILGFLLQFMGGISNVQTHDKVVTGEITSDTNALPKPVAYNAYLIFISFVLFYPLIISMLGFGLYRLIW